MATLYAVMKAMLKKMQECLDAELYFQNLSSTYKTSTFQYDCFYCDNKIAEFTVVYFFPGYIYIYY